MLLSGLIIIQLFEACIWSQQKLVKMAGLAQFLIPTPLFGAVRLTFVILVQVGSCPVLEFEFVLESWIS